MPKYNFTPEGLKRYGQYFSPDSFLAKIKSIALKAGRKLIYNALLLFYVLTSPSTPLRYKQIIIGALGYFILPTDLLPDFIPGIGFAADLAAVLAVVKIVMSCITPEIKSKALAKSQSYL